MVILENVLSLFDGKSCGRLALNKSNIKLNGNYFASEIDKHAIKVTMDNFPDTIQLGDVKKINAYDLPKIDLLIGGSPCQGFSFAGKQLNFDDPRSKLFFEYVRILNECKPKYFLLENVRMTKTSKDVITKYLGVEPIELNSNLVSSQNRRRLYWTNIPNITVPIDKEIFISDIIYDSNDKKVWTINEKLEAIKSSYIGDVEYQNINDKHTAVLKASNEKKVYIDLTKDAPFSFYESRTEEGKAMRRKIRLETGKDSTPRSKEYKMYLPLNDNKCNCLVTIDSPLDFIIDKSWRYRKLTISEMELMQTVPNGYLKSVNDRIARKLLGNGWTVDMITHILNSIEN